MSKKNLTKQKLDAAPQAALDGITGQQTPMSIGADSKDVSKASSTITDVNASKIEEVPMPKVACNTKKAAELVGGGAAPSIGVAAPVLKAAGRINYSGGADYIGGDKSATAEGIAITKSGDRPGRQIDTALQHIDDAPAETYIVNVDTIPQLDQGQSRVGYNGKYRNAHAISQKGSGGSPADSDFFRTIDECQYDNIYFAPGQFVVTDEDDKDLTAKTFIGGSWIDADYTIGNYVGNKLTVTFDANQDVESLVFNFDDISPEEVDDAVYRVSADTDLRERNLSELDRLALIDKAGDETKENWSPLGKAIPNSRETNRLIGDMDKSIGDLLFLSGSKLKTALAYQNNKASKDGLRKVAPMFEMLEGNVEGSTYRFADAGFDGDAGTPAAEALFNKINRDPADALANGSAAMYIAMMDSVHKYNTKGKVLSLPLSFKTAISSFNQNCGEFRMHKEFYDEFNRQETFGKVDGDATGLGPFFISDGAKVAIPVNIFASSNDAKNATLAGDSQSNPMMVIHYEDIRNVYNSPVWNYFRAGLTKYINRYGSKICKYIKANANGKYVWTIPMVSTTTCVSMWDVLLCAATKDIAIERRYALDIMLQYEALNHEYPYHNALKLSDCTIGGTTNVGFTDITSPLRANNIPLNIGTRILLPELFWCKAYGKDITMYGSSTSADNYGTVGSVVLPWYFNQDAFAVEDATDDQAIWNINPDKLSSMTFFDYRGGCTLDNANRIFSMDPEQLKLSLDRMTIAPAMDKQFEDIDLATKLYPTVYKYSYHEDGIPIMLYYIASKSSSDADHRLTIGDILRTPRELGLSCVAPSGYVTGNYDGTDLNYRNLDSSYFSVSGPSFRIRCWSSTPLANVGHNLYDQTRNAGYAVNLQAHYYVIYAQASLAKTDIGITLTANTTAGANLYASAVHPEAMVKDEGGYCYDSGTYDNSEIAVANLTSTDAEIKTLLNSDGVLSTLKYLYTRLNILPFLVNPFDVNTKEFTGTETSTSKKMTACNSADIYDFLHIFNMCGFRCGEYSGAEFDRNKARIELGLGYVSDPYIETRI